MSTPEDDNMFSRWSRRKMAVEQEKEDDKQPVIEANESSEIASHTEDLNELPEQEVLERLGLPNPDLMKKGDDFKPFLQASVPAYLRKRALRTLWASNPILANVDGLVDYGEDFTDSAMVPEVMNTVYRVGKGMLKDILEDAEEGAKDGADLDVAQLEDSQADGERVEDTEDQGEPDKMSQEALSAGKSSEEKEVSDNETPLSKGQAATQGPQIRPRRMRFES